MATVLLVCVVILVIAALVFGIVSLLTGEDPGLVPAEPDGRALPLPNHRSLSETDLKRVRFDLALRGYRMAQVDRALRRTAYDIGYKDEMIAVLEAEVAALREGRLEDADLLRKARESAANPDPTTAAAPTAAADEAAPTAAADEAEPALDGEAAEPALDGEAAEPAEDDVAPEEAEAEAAVPPSDPVEAAESTEAAGSTEAADSTESTETAVTAEADESEEEEAVADVGEAEAAPEKPAATPKQPKPAKRTARA